MKSRPYLQRRRAEAAADTGERILDAALALFLEHGWGLTLEATAAHAGVTVQTVLRRYGSKGGVVEAVAERQRRRVAEERGATSVGDVDGAITNLLDHYEAHGTMALRLLAMEAEDPRVAALAAEGRAFHREWVTRVFAPLLPEAEDPARIRRVDQLVVVTDVYAWKLLHVDVKRSRADTAAALVELVHRLLA